MEVSLITFNVLADIETPPNLVLPGDRWRRNVPVWDERKALCVQTLHQAQPSIIGLQEAWPHQFDFFQSQLLEFSTITVTESTSQDEALLQAVRATYGLHTLPQPHEVVLSFRTREFDQITTGYWWLSPIPDTPSVGFIGNILPRLVLWVQLRHRPSGHELIIFNTHLDFRCTLPMVELCREKIAAFTRRGLPLIFMGDFSFTPTHDDYALLIGDGWHDAHVASSTMSEATHMNGRRIDHIFYRGARVTPQIWTQLFSPDPQRSLSAHHPVYARFRVE